MIWQTQMLYIIYMILVKLYSGHVGAIHRGHAQMRSVPQGAFELFKTEFGSGASYGGLCRVSHRSPRSAAAAS